MTRGGDLLELFQDDGFITTTHTSGETNHSPLHTVFETALPLWQNTAESEGRLEVVELEEQLAIAGSEV